MGNEFGRGKVGKGNDGRSGSGLPRRNDLEKRLCITVPEVALMLGICRNFAYELVRRGEIPTIRFGKRILVPRIALEKILEKGMSQ